MYWNIAKSLRKLGANGISEKNKRFRTPRQKKVKVYLSIILLLSVYVNHNNERFHRAFDKKEITSVEREGFTFATHRTFPPRSFDRPPNVTYGELKCPILPILNYNILGTHIFHLWLDQKP